MRYEPKRKRTKRKNNPIDHDNILTFDEALEIVIQQKELEGSSKHTIYSYKRIFNNELAKYFGKDANLNDLTEQDAKDFMHYQLYQKELKQGASVDRQGEKGVKPVTANFYLMMIQSAFGILESVGKCKNIFEDIPFAKEDEEKIDTLTVDEINRIFRKFDKTKYVDFRDYVCCHLMLDAFSRVGETVILKETDIDLQRKTVTFSKTKGRRFRTVPISNETIKLIKELMAENEDFNSEYLFLNIFGEPLNNYTSVRKRLTEIGKELGINKRVSPHILRHTASKMFIEQGGSIRVLQKILGHASIDTTEKYAHVLDVTIARQKDEFSPIKSLQKKSKTKTGRFEAKKRKYKE